jgi:hypothetical protein
MKPSLLLLLAGFLPCAFGFWGGNKEAPATTDDYKKMSQDDIEAMDDDLVRWSSMMAYRGSFTDSAPGAKCEDGADCVDQVLADDKSAFFNKHFIPEGGFRTALGEQAACLLDKAAHALEFHFCHGELERAATADERDGCDRDFVAHLDNGIELCCTGEAHIPLWDTINECDEMTHMARTTIHTFAKEFHMCIEGVSKNTPCETIEDKHQKQACLRKHDEAKHHGCANLPKIPSIAHSLMRVAVNLFVESDRLDVSTDAEKFVEQCEFSAKELQMAALRERAVETHPEILEKMKKNGMAMDNGHPDDYLISLADGIEAGERLEHWKAIDQVLDELLAKFGDEHKLRRRLGQQHGHHSHSMGHKVQGPASVFRDDLAPWDSPFSRASALESSLSHADMHQLFKEMGDKRREMSLQQRTENYEKAREMEKALEDDQGTDLFKGCRDELQTLWTESTTMDNFDDDGDFFIQEILLQSLKEAEGDNLDNFWKR